MVFTTAFLSSFPLSLPTSTTSSSLSSCPPRTSRARTFMCADRNDPLHPSWSVYDEPGNKCVLCLGVGTTKCLYCFGEGVVTIGPEAARDTITCPMCDATGYETCIRCDGTGIRPDEDYDVETGTWVKNLTNEQVARPKQLSDDDSIQQDTISMEGAAVAGS